MLYNTDHCFLSVFGSQKQTQSFRKLVSPSKKMLEAFVIHLLWAKIFFVLTQFISVVGVKDFENTTSIYLRDWTVEMQKGQSQPVERLFLVLPKTTEQCYNKHMWKINIIFYEGMGFKHTASLFQIWGDGGCDDVGRAVTSETRGPRFESSHRHIFFKKIYFC